MKEQKYAVAFFAATTALIGLLVGLAANLAETLLWIRVAMVVCLLTYWFGAAAETYQQWPSKRQTIKRALRFGRTGMAVSPWPNFIQTVMFGCLFGCFGMRAHEEFTRWLIFILAAANIAHAVAQLRKKLVKQVPPVDQDR